MISQNSTLQILTNENLCVSVDICSVLLQDLAPILLVQNFQMNYNQVLYIFSVYFRLNGTKDQRSLNRTSSPSLTRMVSSPSRLSMHNLETLENTNVSPPINWDLIPLIVLLLQKVHNTVVTVFQQNLQVHILIFETKGFRNQFNDKIFINHKNYVQY